jgi:uncharacterized protein with HEPN domain
MVDDVLLNEVAIIERCVARVLEVHAGDARNVREDLTRQDSIILNIQRACEAAGIVPAVLARSLRRMVGFRSVAVHEYRKLSLDVVEQLLAYGLDDLLAFTALLLKRS